MSEQPRPVRAWAEYDEWSTFSSAYEGNWDFVVTPKGATGEAAAGATMSFETALKGRYIEAPLRTLRVLLSTGQWVELVRKADSVTISRGRKAVMLDPGCMKFSLFAPDGTWLHGGWYMPEVTDADAVARAIAEAVAWVSEREGVKA